MMLGMILFFLIAWSVVGGLAIKFIAEHINDPEKIPPWKIALVIIPCGPYAWVASICVLTTEWVMPQFIKWLETK